MSLSIVYFPLRARGEGLRMLCELAKLPYTEETIQFADWGAAKPTMPGGTMPSLRGADGVLFGDETIDCILHLAGLADAALELVPASDADKATARSVFDVANTAPFAMLMPLAQYFPADDAAPRIAGAVDAALKVLEGLESHVAAGTADAPFFGGKQPHYAEIYVS
jgi:glutathione S-transferase